MFESIHRFFAKSLQWIKNHNTLTIVMIALASIFTAGIVAIVIISLAVFATPFLGIYYLVYLIKTYQYYKTDEFMELKNKLSDKIVEYNEFDNFMSETRDYIAAQQQLISTNNLRHSTLTVYKNSQLDAYKYIVKYFFNDTKINEESVQAIEKILQKYSTLERTYEILNEEYTELMKQIKKDMYSGAYVFKAHTMRKLGSRKPPKFARDYYIWYSFEYTSPANKKHYSHRVILEETKLQDFAEYLNALIKHRKSVKYQRQLMTVALRGFILDRDNHTCKTCGISTRDEAHLLLEIDHIVPVSKGGITTEANLQALCWKCNRSKSNKIVSVTT